MFRGSKGLTGAQLNEITGKMGGESNAFTTNDATQYTFVAPAIYLDVLLRIEADRMRGALLTDADWKLERGAIEQEVSRDISDPGFLAFERAEEDPVRRHRLCQGSSGHAALLRQDHVEDAARVLRRLVSAGQRDPGDRRRRRPADDTGQRQVALRLDAVPAHAGAQAGDAETVQGADHRARHAGRQRHGAVPVPHAGHDFERRCRRAGAGRCSQQSAQRALRAGCARHGAQRRRADPAVQPRRHRQRRGRVREGRRRAAGAGASRPHDRSVAQGRRVARPGRGRQALRARAIRIQQEQRGEPCQRMVAGARLAGTRFTRGGRAANSGGHGGRRQPHRARISEAAGARDRSC